MHEVTSTQWLQIIRQRRAQRHFQNAALPEATLNSLLDAARWAPSGYNLQPTHFIVVQTPKQRERLHWACLGQRQIEEAPAAVVFAGDKRVMVNHFERVLAMDREVGATDARYEALLRKFVPLAFKTGPLGLNWLWKATLPPLARWFRGVPSIPAVHRRYWLAKQAGLAAMNFMLAAEAQGVATCPMEGFDPRRVRQALNMPRTVEPMIVVAAGYPADEPGSKTRLPIEELVHHERW
jgi:nitroreductase